MVAKKSLFQRLKLSIFGGAAPNNNVLAPVYRAPNDRPTMTSGVYPFAKSPFPSANGADTAGPNGISSDQVKPEAFDASPKLNPEAIGNTGTQIFGGYYSEEYINTLRGRTGARKWDEMRRSEAQISLILNAITNPIKAANWDFEPYQENNADFQKHTDLVKYCITEQIDFNSFKHEALTFMPFGFSLFEIVHSVNHNDPKFGTFNGLKALGFRSQKTIENWILEPQTGRLKGVNQYTYSDLGGNQFLDGDFLLVFSHSKEGDNYEGISVLRPMYGAYVRKELYLKLAAIGIERYAIGTPIGTVPAGKERSTEYDEFKKLLQSYTSHEASFIVKPQGWDIEIQKGDFDADKIKELLVFENGEMVNAVVANFLILGMNGGGGAYALGSNLGEFFTSGIQSYADLICDVVNRCLIPNLIKLNYVPQPGYPKMKVTGISDKAGKDLAETIKLLADGRALDPDQPLKEWLRKMYKMPKPDVSTAVPLPVTPAGGNANFPKQGEPTINPTTGQPQLSEPIRLADKKYVAKFDKNKAKLKELMQTQLTEMYGQLKLALKKKYKYLKGSDKILAPKNLSMPGLAAYKGMLRQALAEVARDSIQSAKKQVKGGSKLKLIERLESVKLADTFDALPPAVRKLIEAQSILVAETQAADIEKQVFFSFTSDATVTEDIDAILNSVDETVLPSLEGSTKAGMSLDAAAGDAIAHVIQQSALEVFFEPEVLDGIESFTFTNEDPVSEICQELAGTTWAVGDPDLDRYSPPLHHNCKSRLVPNLKGDSDNPEIDRGGTSLSKKALDAITLSEKKRKVSKA